MDTNETRDFHILSHHAPTVLPRVALLFSRRGVDIARLAMSELEDGSHASYSVSARCDERQAGLIEAQLRRIVEIVEVSTVGTEVAPWAVTA